MKLIAYFVITSLMFFSGKNVKAEEPRFNPEIFGTKEPVFVIRIGNNMPLSRLHREDDGLSKMYGPEKELQSIFYSTNDSENISVVYLLKKRNQKYENGEYLLQYQWILMADKTPIYQGKFEKINLNCKTNEYYASGKKIRGEYFVLPGKRYQVNPKTTFGQWANTICDSKFSSVGKSYATDFFKQLRRGYF